MSDATGTNKTKSTPSVKCDQCQKPFEIVLKEKPLPGGGIQRRFRCSHCGKYYLVANISAAGVKIRRQVWQAEARAKMTPGDEALAAELEQLRGVMRAEVTSPGAA